MIDFIIDCTNTHQHIFNITLSMDSADNPQEFMLPNWIAGSYKIRDYARNITNIEVKNGEIEQVSKNRFRVQTADKKIILSYSMYGFEQSVRHAYLDENRAFFNGNSLFLLPIGFENNQYSITLSYPDTWQVATSLECKDNNTYIADNYKELLDSPFEIANFNTLDFAVNDIPHSLSITGNYESDEKKLTGDLTKICNHHHTLFGCFPVDKYLFLTLATFNNFGGLEHTKSTSLICSRKELNNQIMNENYMRFLSLCAHEYFHTWWIKSLKPKSFHSLDLERENYTRQLWIFEGITSYYDDYSLYRCGLITQKQYLKLFAKTVNRVLQNTGNLKQSIADASFNAWTQLYQADENTGNACANYYSKGALVAFLLDIEVQKRTNSRLSLDDIVRYTYVNFHASGLGDNDFQKVLEKLTNTCFQEFFDDFVYGIMPLPLAQAFEYIGVKIIQKPATITLGCAIKDNKITRVFTGSCAENAGICVGDEMILLDGEKSTNIEEELQTFEVGSGVSITLIRDNLQLTKTIEITNNPNPEIELVLK